MRLLFAEDDRHLLTSIARGLREASHEVDQAANGTQALSLALANDYDSIILDVLMPGKSGIEVCRAIREHGSRVPILMLTALDAVEQRIAGLDAGADDYLTKPFRLAELLARVRACTRRSEATMDDLSLGDLTIDLDGRRVCVGPDEIELRPKEFDLLVTLAHNAGRVVPRDRILRDVWDEHWFGSTKTLDIHIWSLRKKLDKPDAPSRITTVRGVGYRLERP